MNNMDQIAQRVKGKKLLILAGASVHQKVVLAAKKMGVYTIVTDYLTLDQAPAKKIAEEYWMNDILDVDGLVDRCLRENVDGVLNFCIDPAQIPYQRIAERLGLPCFGTKEQFRTLTDKWVFKDFCRNCGVDVIPEYGMNDINSGNVVYPVLVKPTNSRGSRGQSICNTKEEVYTAIGVAKEASSDGGFLIERYMVDAEDMALAYMVIDREPYLVKIGDRLLGRREDKLERQQISTILPSRHTKEFHSYSDVVIRKMIKQLGIKFGPVFFQGFWENGKVYLYDPGLRFPGSDFNIAQYAATGFDSVSTCVAFALTGATNVCVGDPRGVYDYNGGAGVVLSIAARSGRIAIFEGFDNVSRDPRVVSSSLLHSVGDEIRPTGDICQRVAEFIAYIPNRADVPDFYRFVYNNFKVLDYNGENMSISEVKPEALRIFNR